jgi:hypothetical protein
MYNIGQRILNETNLIVNDRSHYFENLLDNPEDYLSWQDVETCVNNPHLFDFEMIDKFSNKINIPAQQKAWISNKLVQDKRFLADGINAGNTLIIMNYGFYSQKTNDLLNVFERIFDIDTAIHVYCGLGDSKSFKIHDDYPPNFIIQVEGETHWKVFKNRISSLYKTGTQQHTLSEDQLEVETEVVLKPGDGLYIPSRAYHWAVPLGKRLSMSIPCWQRLPTSNQTVDRNFYKINYD